MGGSPSQLMEGLSHHTVLCTPYMIAGMDFHREGLHLQPQPIYPPLGAS